MRQRLGQILKAQRGSETRLSFAKRLDLSYTFVRSLEEGLRRPSDEVLIEIAAKLDYDADDLILAAYCDRSPYLEGAFRRRGRDVLGEEEAAPAAPLPGPTPAGFEVAESTPPIQPVEGSSTNLPLAPPGEPRMEKPSSSDLPPSPLDLS